MINMAMGYENIFEFAKLNVLSMILLCGRGRWAGIKKNKFAIHFRGVAMHRADHIWSIDGMLLNSHISPLFPGRKLSYFKKKSVVPQVGTFAGREFHAEKPPRGRRAVQQVTTFLEHNTFEQLR